MKDMIPELPNPYGGAESQPPQLQGDNLLVGTPWEHHDAPHIGFR